MGDRSPIINKDEDMGPRYKRSEREGALSETRRKLMEAAVAEFARAGYNGAKVDRISQAAGFAKGTIYNHFESKRALMFALIDDTAAMHLDFIAGRVLVEEDTESRLERFFEAGFEFVTQYLARGRVMINVLFGPDSEFKQSLYQAYGPMFDLVREEILVVGIEQLKYRQVDVGLTTGLLMTMYLGVASGADDDGVIWFEASQLADFVARALRK
jgi:AcrR family transcriptional regulator